MYAMSLDHILPCSSPTLPIPSQSPPEAGIILAFNAFSKATKFSSPRPVELQAELLYLTETRSQVFSSQCPALGSTILPLALTLVSLAQVFGSMHTQT